MLEDGQVGYKQERGGGRLSIGGGGLHKEKRRREDNTRLIIQIWASD